MHRRRENDQLVKRLIFQDRRLAAGGACGPRRCAPGGQPVTSHLRADVDGIPIALFSEVEQVAEDTEPTVLASRLHQHGQVVGQGLDSVYVRFRDNQVISVRPELVRVLGDTSGGE